MLRIQQGDHIDDEIAYLANYVSRYPDISEYYDCLVEERCIGEIDFSQIDNRDELVSLWIPYVGDIETPSENEYFEYLCGVIEMFPNLKYYHLIYTPFSQDVRDSLVSRINDRYSNISEI